MCMAEVLSCRTWYHESAPKGSPSRAAGRRRVTYDPDMRILLVSDLHANRFALAALRETYDLCLCLGDLVDYGGSPAEAVAWVRERAAHCVRGNHDHGAAHDVVVTGGVGFK